MKGLFTKAEFWIFFFLLLRLFGITNPPLEGAHNWRQTTGLMVARNYYEVDANILHPRIDDHQGGSGIIGMEFPALNYLHFLIAETFGYEHWYGRLINLIVSSFGIWFFVLFLRSFFFEEKLVTTAAVLLSTSIWFSFSRKMMPDTFCISLMMGALHFGRQYLLIGKNKSLVLSIIFCTISMLSKISASIYLALLIPVWMDDTIEISRKKSLFVFLLLPVGITYFWYFIYNPSLAEAHGTWYNIGKPWLEGLSDILSHPKEVLDNFYFDAFAGFIGFGVSMVGLGMLLKTRQSAIIRAIGLVTFVFILYMVKSGYYFYHHNYYIIPFVPILAFSAAYALSLIKHKAIFLTLLILTAVESIANQQHDFFIKKDQKYKLGLEGILDQHIGREELIAINGGENPQMIYLSHRKGWTLSNDQIQDQTLIKSLKENGCKWLVLDKKDLSNQIQEGVVIFEDDYFLIIKI